jgi:hypothetical protein
MTWTRRILKTLGGALLAVVLTASAASADVSLSVADRKGDGLGPGDVRALRVAQAGSNFSLRVRTEKPLNFDVAPAWQNEATRSILRIFLDTNTEHAGADTVVVLDNEEGSLVAKLVHLDTVSSPRGGCLPVITQPQFTQIQLTFDVACLGSGSVRAYAVYRFDQGGNGTQDSIDRVPNAGWSPRLVLES